MRALVIFTQWLVRKHMRTALIWTAAFTLFVSIIVAIYPTFRDAGMLDVVKNYPEPMRKMFNIDEMATFRGFLSVEVFSYIPLILSFFTINLLGAAIAGEEERGAMDIFLAQPISRVGVVVANVITATFWTLVMLLTAATTTWVLAQSFDEVFTYSQSIQGFLGLFPIMMVFGAFALAAGSQVRTRGAATGAAFLVMFLFYVVDLVGKLVPDYSDVRIVSPFRWHGEPILNGFYWNGAGILLGAAALLVIFAVIRFRRRDIYT